MQMEHPQDMPPGFPELWEGVSRARMDIAELKGMMKMHFQDTVHHSTPCATAEGIQNTLHTALGAAIVSLLSAVGCLILELIRFAHS